MTDFRLCLTCPSYSQADLYHYALQLISDQFESTFAHLRYFLGGDRPSQTTDHAMSGPQKILRVKDPEKKQSSGVAVHYALDQGLIN